jgi:hypothetical protein
MLANLPTEILDLILGHISTEHRIILSLCNKSMRCAIVKSFGWRQIELPREIQVRKLRFSFLVSFILKQIIPNLSYLTHFSTNGYRGFDDPHLSLLKPYSQGLLSLDLRDTRVSEKGLLDFFDMQCGPMGTISGREALCSRPLSRLILSNKASVTDLVLEIIGLRCPHLDELDLSQMRSYRFTTFGINNMLTQRISKGLKKIILSGCAGIDDQAIMFIAFHCPVLEHFDCRGAFLVGNEGIGKLIMNCPIQYLDISYCWRITDLLFECLLHPNHLNHKAWNYLKEIYFHFCYQISEETVAIIESMPVLHTVGLSNINYISSTAKQRLRDNKINVVE